MATTSCGHLNRSGWTTRARSRLLSGGPGVASPKPMPGIYGCARTRRHHPRLGRARQFNVTQGKNWDSSTSHERVAAHFTGPDMLADIELTTRVNGELRQQDRTGRMIFSFTKIINYVSTFTALAGGYSYLRYADRCGRAFRSAEMASPGRYNRDCAKGLDGLRNGVRDEEV